MFVMRDRTVSVPVVKPWKRSRILLNFLAGIHIASIYRTPRQDFSFTLVRGISLAVLVTRER